jgi:nitrate ABC transporter ATP-binding subunit
METEFMTIEKEADIKLESASSLSIEIKDLTISFPTPKGTYTAVTGIDLSIKRGEIVSLIGHSGCGKSTILNAIGGMIKPASGEVLVNNKQVIGPGPDRGIVFQNYSLLPWLSVYNNIYEAVDSVMKQKSAAEKREIVSTFINMVGLWDHKDKFPSQISGGMKQRVAIARAFSINPNVLLLDEPFGALDAFTKSSLHLELLTLWNLDNRSKTILLVTHDVDEAIFLSDRIVVMTDGPAASIREIENVHLTRPRNKKDIVHNTDYLELRDRLLTLLTDKFSVEDYGIHYKA